jgi:putative membrane protein
MVMMIVFWGGLIALAVWGISRATRSRHPGLVDSPRTILDRRFASGEIDAESYAQARRTLEGPL